MLTVSTEVSCMKAWKDTRIMQLLCKAGARYNKILCKIDVNPSVWFNITWFLCIKQLSVDLPYRPALCWLLYFAYINYSEGSVEFEGNKYVLIHLSVWCKLPKQKPNLSACHIDLSRKINSSFQVYDCWWCCLVSEASSYKSMYTICVSNKKLLLPSTDTPTKNYLLLNMIFL